MMALFVNKLPIAGPSAKIFLAASLNSPATQNKSCAPRFFLARFGSNEPFW